MVTYREAILSNAVTTSYYSSTKVSVPNELVLVKYVFVRLNDHRSPFQYPYHKPYEVTLPGTKTFRVRVGENCAY